MVLPSGIAICSFLEIRHHSNIFQFDVLYITKTYLYNFDPLKPHFYIVKQRFTEVYITFLISGQTHRLWVLVRTDSQSDSNEYQQSMFWAEIWKIIRIFIWKLSVFGGETFNRRVCVMNIGWFVTCERFLIESTPQAVTGCIFTRLRWNNIQK